MYTVYVLKSLTNGRCYTGSTNSLKRRLEEHKGGKSKYTKLTKPFKLIYREHFKTRKEAYNRELFLKSGKGREYIKSILEP